MESTHTSFGDPQAIERLYLFYSFEWTPLRASADDMLSLSLAESIYYGNAISSETGPG
jgi:hypothetical protein